MHPFYQSVIEYHPDAVFTLDRQGRIRSANTAAVQVSGYTLEALRGMEWASLVRPEQAAEAARLLQSAAGGEPQRFECEIVCEDGLAAELRVTFVPVVIEDEVIGLYAIAGDITEQKRAQMELQVKEQQYRGIFEAAAIGKALTNMSGKLFETNRALQDFLGYSAEELFQLPFTVFTHPEDAPRQIVLFDELMAGKREFFQIEKRYIRKDGSLVWGRLTESLVRDAEGRPSFAIAMVEDISERMQAEEQLREREEQYRSIVQATSDGLLILDLDGRIVEANQVAGRMYGYAYDELIGMSASALSPAGRLDMSKEGIRVIAERGSYEAQGIALRKDGTTFHVEVNGRSFMFRGAPAILGVVRDITERVEAYELLEQRVEERTRELSALLDVSRTVASTLQLQPLLGLILDGLKQVVDYHAASIFEIVGEDLTTIQYRGPAPQGEVLGRRLHIDPRMAVWPAITGGESVIIDDVRGEGPAAESYRVAVGPDLETAYSFVTSFLAVPMILGDRIIGLMTVSHSQPAFYTSQHAQLVAAIASGAAVAIENAHLYEQAQEIAALEERQKLARELHDSVSQALYGIALGARTARTLLDGSDPSAAIEPLEYVLAQAHAGLSEMRALIFELRPDALEREGLVAALAQRADPIRTRHGIEILMELGEEPDVPFVIKEALYRIAQEAIHNTTKHAQARHIHLRLERGPDTVTLEVRDDGKGFDPEGSFPGHLGLRSMRERATRLGGYLQLESSAQGGTSVHVSIPCTLVPSGAGSFSPRGS